MNSKKPLPARTGGGHVQYLVSLVYNINQKGATSMKWHEKLYAFYSEGEYVCEATIAELMETTDYPSDTLRWMASPNKRVRERDTVLVELVDLDIFLCSLSIPQEIIDKLHGANIYTAEDLLAVTQDELAKIIRNQGQRRKILTYYNYFKKKVEEDESYQN